MASAQQEHAAGASDSGRMVMPTEDAKALRLMRPTLAALQVKLALAGHFEGSINGLYGPSTHAAMVAYQKTRDRAVTGWPDLAVVLTLMDVERGIAERLADRVDLRARPGTDRKGPSVLPGAGTLTGDPQPAKRIRSMSGRMAAENEHVRALRAVRALLGAVQLRLAEVTLYAGPVSGLPDEPGLSDALAAWQVGEGVDPTGKLDLTTSLRLFGLDPERLDQKLDRPVLLDGSPVSMDRALLEQSMNRFPSPLRDPSGEPATKGESDGGK